MRNKKLLLITAIFLFATMGYANNFLEGLGFVAPTIIGKSNVFNPAAGEIIYDQSDATFYGQDHNSQWQPLSGAAGGSNPSGAIIAFGGAVAPSGYLLCDGSAVSRTTYAGLFAVIGTAFGEGDGSTTFNLPDLRGRFLRGVDDGTGNDPDAGSRTAMNTGGNAGDNVGSIQDDQYKQHNHNVGIGINNASGSSGSAAFTFSGGTVGPARTSANSGGSESRPKNAYVNFIIKL